MKGYEVRSRVESNSLPAYDRRSNRFIRSYVADDIQEIYALIKYIYTNAIHV